MPATELNSTLAAGADASLDGALQVGPGRTVRQNDHVEEQVAESADEHAYNRPMDDHRRSADRLRSFVFGGLIGASAVIAAVTAGIYLGWHTPELTTPEVRLIGVSTWQIVIFVLNALLFTLIGLQLPGILDELDAYYGPSYEQGLYG